MRFTACGLLQPVAALLKYIESLDCAHNRVMRKAGKLTGKLVATTTLRTQLARTPPMVLVLLLVLVRTAKRKPT